MLLEYLDFSESSRHQRVTQLNQYLTLYEGRDSPRPLCTTPPGIRRTPPFDGNAREKTADSSGESTTERTAGPKIRG